MKISTETKFNFKTERPYDFNRFNNFGFSFATEPGFDFITNTDFICDAYSFYTTELASQVYSLVPYYGGKHYLAKRITPRIYEVAAACNATTYIELCGGGARCLLNLDQNKHRFEQKYYNEFDETMCCLFNMARDESKVRELLEYLQSLDYPMLAAAADSEACMAHYAEIFRSSKIKLDKNTGLVLDKTRTEIEKAAAAYITCRLSRNANRRNFNFDNLRTYLASYARLLEAPSRLENTTVLQGDCRPILREFGQDKRTVIFMDPPYHPQCRSKNALKIYPKEMPREEQQEMVELACETKCAVVMSGYNPADYGCDDYKDFEKHGFEMIPIARVNVPSANSTRALAGREMLYKIEYLWVKKASI